MRKVYQKASRRIGIKEVRWTRNTFLQECIRFYSRMEQLNLREELEAQIEETRAQLEAFVNVAGHDYNQVAKEYRDTKDQIEQCNWALKEISSPTSPSP